MKFEYLCEHVDGTSLETTRFLDQLAKMGWELVAVTDDRLYLRRPTPSEPDVRTFEHIKQTTDMVRKQLAQQRAIAESGVEIRPTYFPETHWKGNISIENRDLVPPKLDEGVMFHGDLGVQIAEDGRVWVCINGIAFLRFTPDRKAKGDVKDSDGGGV